MKLINKTGLMNTNLKLIFLSLVLSLLTACGGGGGSPGSTSAAPSNTTTSNQDTATLSVTDFVVATNKNTLDGGGLDKVELVITALNSSRNIVPGAFVQVAVGIGAVFTSSSGTSTSADGIYKGDIRLAEDRSTRTLSVSVRINGIAKTTLIQVVGTGTSSISPSTATLSVTDIILSTNKNNISNSGLDTVVLTITALNSTRNVVADASVNVTISQSAAFSAVSGNITGVDGTYRGNITIGSDKSNREVFVTALINNVSRTTSIQVVGSKIVLSTLPSTPAPGQIGTVTVAVTDFASNPIPGITLTFAGTLPVQSGAPIVTSLLGIATSSFRAPTIPGLYSITARGVGVSSSELQVRVFDVAVPVAVIPAGASPSLAATPNVLAVNTPGSSANQSTLRFNFLDSLNNPIQNVRVKFEDLTTGLPAIGASLSTGTQTVYTDLTGQARAQYIAGQNASSTNGVFVRACYSPVDFVSAVDCPNAVTVFLTVAGQALAVSIGDDNVLSSAIGIYTKRFVVSVADAAGKPIVNAPVDVSVDLVHYRKARNWAPYSFPQSISPAEPSTYSYTTTVAGVTTTLAGYWCLNEDTNRNGIVDAGENIDGSLDVNGQPTLEPRKSDLLVSYDAPTVTTTNSNGFLIIKVEYSQRFGGWLNYRIRVTTSVLGSQGQAERSFVSDVLESDVRNGSFQTPPYGFQNCRTAG